MSICIPLYVSLASIVHIVFSCLLLAINMALLGFPQEISVYINPLKSTVAHDIIYNPQTRSKAHINHSSSIGIEIQYNFVIMWISDFIFD